MASGRDFSLRQQRDQPPQDHRRYLTAQLLVDNGSDERFKTRLAMLDSVGAHTLDDGAHHGIGFLEVKDGLAHWNEN